ncbi:MAG: large repetitive protein, partial [Acidobacteriota bacterium]|nr:large repetitive protein [Acidobacteriota bacterium]
MYRKRKRRVRPGERPRLSNRRRRELLIIFALIFGTAGARGVAHAKPVPFASQPPISTSADSAITVYVADVDGDGDLDALSASGLDDKIAWYENVGGGATAWVLHTISTTADNAVRVYAADMDGDGDLDALSASRNDFKIAWYENVGGGGTSWVLHTISNNADSPISVHAADVDGDGDLDALSASTGDNTIAWYENLGGGGTSWAPHAISSTVNGATSVYAADVDGDGDLDALSASVFDNTIAWHENFGGGGTSWVLHTISTSAIGAVTVVAADVDGDGDLDALSASNTDDKIAWYENVSGGGTSWVLHTISTSANFAVVVSAADVDGDGDIDALSASVDDDKIAWYENVGGGGTSWVLHTVSTSANGAETAYAADLDGDGDLDVLSASYADDTIAWYRNDSIHRGVRFVSPPEISTDADFAQSVYTADVDGDGDLDALSASSSDDKIAWYENVGGGGTSWALHTISTGAAEANSVYAADMDGDGDIDALSASAIDNKVAWYENLGGGGTSWTLHTISTSAMSAYSVYAADVDGDGDIDALSASGFDGKIAWYENLGSGETSWALHTISTSALGAYWVYAADVDGDGDIDALSASRHDDKIAWYENAGGGGTSWALHTISTVAGDANSVYAADVDGDGDIDTLSASGLDNKIAWHENVGGAGTSWVLHTISTSADGAYSVYAADVDGDGDFDALSASILDDKIAWYENEGGGGTSWVLHTISTTANFAHSVYAADLDGDGDFDALSASLVDDKIAWYENRVGGMDFNTVTPCRLLDTRVLGQGPALTTGNRELVVPPNCGIPVDALAVALNVTVVSPTVGGHVTVFPGATAAPGTSTINFSAGQTRANNQVVGLAPDFSGKLILRAVV